jgi:hypothetical protein
MRRNCPLLSLPEALTIMASSLADAWGVDMNADAANPSPMMSPLVLRMRLIWFRAPKLEDVEEHLS